METLTFAGKEYVKAKSAARELGYTPDYIGQLCRAGKIDARLVGRSWYVDIEELEDHKKLKYGKKNTKAIKGRSLSSPETQPASAGSRLGGDMNYSAHATQPAAYETDPEALLPPIPKKDSAHDFNQQSPHIDDEAYEAEQVSVSQAASKKYNNENIEGHKISVIDATDEPSESAETPSAAERKTTDWSESRRQGAAAKEYSKRDYIIMQPKRAPSSPDNRYVRRRQRAQKSTSTHPKGSTTSSGASLMPYVVAAAVAAVVVLVLVLGVQIEITSTTAQTSEQFGFSAHHFMDKIGF